MDCSEPVDDYCRAFQIPDRRIPAGAPKNSDQFFVYLELEVLAPRFQEDEDEEEYEEIENQFTVEARDCITMWAPCPRVESGNLPREKISRMLSAVGVPLHKQEDMVDEISARADVMANCSGNKDRRVLPMHVSASIVTCLCYGESVDD